MEDNKRSIDIEVNADTDKMIKKLRAIAKHVTALADELDEIDGGWKCMSCGSQEYTELYCDGELYQLVCGECGQSFDA